MMNEIKCPSCGTVFQIDERTHENVVKQIRDKEFEKEISARIEQLKLDKESAVKLAVSLKEKEHHEELAKKNLEINSLNAELKNKEAQTQSKLEKEYTLKLNEQNMQIEELKSILKRQELDRELALKEAISKKEKEMQDEMAKRDLEINSLSLELKNKEEQTQNKLEKEYTSKLNEQRLEIEELKSNLKQKEMDNSLAIKEAISEKDKTIYELNTKLEANNLDFLRLEKSLKENYEGKIKDKDEQIAYYKDFKARQSTKMVGESLEVHCSNEFNKLRPLFVNSYFEKDNDVKTGSKGDFIFRDFDDDGTEIVSIMFEMKNEMDATSTKHKNEDFFKELDKDRKEKKCEYAVLVSLLEMDNDYYNNGIVDVSHKYSKMYVIRPQFFIPLITLIRGMAMNSLKYKKELQVVQNQNIDIANFEDNMNNFKEAFGRNYRIASDKFKKAIEEIDKTIDHLQKTKDALLSSDNNLRLANNKAEELTIKKLTKNSETMAKLFQQKALEKVEDNDESTETEELLSA